MPISRLTSRSAMFAGQAGRSAIANAQRQSASAAGVGIDTPARIDSYTLPTNVLTGVDAGASASIQTANHTRVYPVQGNADYTVDVAIAGIADITGLAYTTTYYVYYDDDTLSDPTPVMHATTVQRDAQVGAAPGRHFVGTVTTPAAAGAPTGGGGGYPPGGGGGGALP